MHEYIAPAEFEVPAEWSCAQPVADWAAREPGHVLFNVLSGDRSVPMTAERVDADVRSAAKGLIASGVGTGDRVGLLANTSYEWSVIDFAIWTAGAVTVPIYESSSADQIRWILEDSGATFLVVEAERHLPSVTAATEGLESVAETLVIQGSEPALDVLASRSADVTDEALAERRDAVSAESPATLIYTSGTTGRPKGVMLTHKNFHSEALSILETPFSQYLRPDASTVMFLPLAHVLARAITYASIYAGTAVTPTSDLPNIVEIFGKAKPHYILAVPRVFDKVFNSAQAKAQDGGAIKAAIFSRAVDTAIAYSRANGKPGLLLKAKHALYSRLVYGKLLEALGGRCEVAISGGAALGERLGHFFDGIGLAIFEGYGLTETTAACCVNIPGGNRIGTVGQPMPGQGVRIAADGEIEITGSVVAAGYWNNEAATEESFGGGWFRTGDLGSLDADGYLRITGRKKEILVTAGGKNVAPNILEDGLRADPLIAEAIAVGDGQPFISALITLDPEQLERWAKQNDKSGSISELRGDADLVAAIDAAVAHANKAVSHAEAIKKYTILGDQFTEEGGELTPSLKLKRKVVQDKYYKNIEAFYSK